MSKTASPKEQEHLGQHALDAVLWSALQRWVARICGLATVAILARLLGPHDFGTVAVALAVLPVAYLLGDMGFSTYITQATTLGSRALSTVFWFSAAAGALLSTVIVLAAPLADLAFGVENAASVVRGIVPAVMFVMLSTVPTALLRRQLRFKALAAQSFVGSFIGQIVAVVLAVGGAGVWALIAQAVCNQAVVSVLAWVAAGWRPSFTFSRTEFATMASFGVKVVGIDLIEQLRTWVEYAVISSTLGAAGLGYLNIAQRLIVVAQDVTSAALLPVSTVVFARVRGSSAVLRSAYLRALGLSYAAVSCAMVFVVVTAPSLVPLLFGEQWGPSIRAAQILAAAGVLTMGAMLDQGLFYGSGRPGLWFCYAVAIDGLTIANAAVMARHGLVAWCSGFLIVAMLATVVRWSLVARLTSTRAWSAGAVLMRSTLASAVTTGAGLLTFHMTGDLDPVLRIGVTGVVVVIVHVVGMFWFMRPELREVERLVLPRLRGLAERWESLQQRSARTRVDEPVLVLTEKNAGE